MFMVPYYILSVFSKCTSACIIQFCKLGKIGTSICTWYGHHVAYLNSGFHHLKYLNIKISFTCFQQNMNCSNQQLLCVCVCVCVCEKCLLLSVLYLLIPLMSQKHDFFIWVTDYEVCENVEIIGTALWGAWLVML